MAVGLACYFNSRYRRWHKDLDQLARSMERLPGVPTKVEFADIKKATGNFHEAMKLGGGGFGTVYRCTLTASASKTERPMDVAVKRFTRDVQNRCYDDFLAEVSIINRLRHKNIVPFVGWSYNKGEPLLVFEFMTNGSLDQHLFPKVSNGTGLQQAQRTGTAIRQWATRYGIVRDIATGLHYVHHEYEPMVLHRDIKASNVMLDSSYRARLGDFGLACTVDVGRNSATGVGGTWGYIAPEYAMCGKATRQTDIYALGVLILEVVTGQRALIRQTVDEGDAQITDRVWRLHRERRLMECVHVVLITGSSPDEDPQHAGGDAERLLLLGLACSSPNPSDRPSMPEVVQVIAKSAPPPEVPLMKPIFMWPPPEGAAWGADDSTGTWMMNNLDGSITSTERQSQSLTAVLHRRATGGHASFQLEHEPSVYVTVSSALGSGERPSR
uniref:Protein kinase domain-containing protein n=1 Tax=Triticum urartu TaxID=4572 RepID=A0A8R7UZG0_TRIUA